MKLAIDFDGTIARTDFPRILGEVPYAVKYIKRLHEEGHYIIIWTCRCGKEHLDAINWLLERGVPFDRVNDHHPEISADCYIDDRNAGGFQGWEAVYSYIQTQVEIQ